DLPGVGGNLQDHPSVGMLFEAAGPFTFDRELRADRFALSLLRWQLLGEGPLAGLPVGAQGFVRTRAGLDRPDLQILISPVAMDARVWFPGWRKRRGDYLTVSNVLLHPESRGSVRLKSADPLEKPAVRLNLLVEEADRAAFRRFIRFARELLATAPARDLVKAEISPSGGMASDAEINAFVRRAIGTAMHPAGSCAMGAGADAVVDEQLRVHGVDGLRVADCSIMPVIVGGNTNAPAIMIAEKAADMIRGRESEAIAA
ncbi:MAG TPA: GMC oxidoreductase, partial [Sphingobium sp.]